MKRSFANLVAKKESGGGTNVFGNISVASAAGEARVPAKNISFPATDVCNYAMPNLEVTVINARNHSSPKMIGQIVVTALVHKVKTQDNGFCTTFDLPSGVSVTMALKKTSSSEAGMDKVAKPHALADKFALIPCSGIVNFTVKGKNNGPGGTDLRIEEHLLPGSMLEVMRFSADAKPGNNGEFNVYCSADTVSPLIRPPFVTMRSADVVDKCFENPSVHREAFVNIARGTGEAQHPVLMAWLKKDIQYLIPKLEDIKRDFKNRKVGMGQPFETLAMSADAEDGINQALAWMNMYLEDPDDNLPASCDIIDATTTLDLSRVRFAPFLQSAAGPFDKAALGCMQSGVGPRSFEFSNGDHIKHPKLQFYTEALISSSKKPSADKSVGSLELNVVSACIAAKHPETGEWTSMVPKLKNNTAVCLGQLISSGKKTAAPALQTFDFGRMPTVVNEIVPYAPMAIFLSRMAVNNTKVCDTEIQPLISGDWGGDNVLDYVSGIRNAGVQLSVGFVDDHLCDDGEVVSMDAGKLFKYVEVDSSGEAKAPTKHRFEVTGFNGLNCFEETKIKKFKLKQNMPPGGENIEYYAIFEGSSDAVMGDADLNTDTDKGDKFIADKLAADKTFAKEKMALYAIAVASSTDGKSEATDDPEPKKAKKETDSDSE